MLFLSQLFCYTMLALLVSMILQTTFQARLVVSLLLFLGIVVLPSFFYDASLLTSSLMMPCNSWSFLHGLMEEWNGPLVEQILFSCAMLWSVTIALFLLTCSRMQRWLDRV